MQRFSSRFKKLAVAVFIATFTLILSGCFQTAGASLDTTITTTTQPSNPPPANAPTEPPAVQPSPLPALPSAVPPEQPTLAPQIEPTIPALAQADTPGPFGGGPQGTMTAQAILFAQATEILNGVTQQAALTQTAESTAQGTFSPDGSQPGQPPVQQPGGQPAQPVQPGQPTQTPLPQGTPGAPGSGAAGTLASDCTYTIVDGDRLFRIALRFGLTPETLARANGMVNMDAIYPGEKLRIPFCFGQPTVTPTRTATARVIIVTATQTPSPIVVTATPTGNPSTAPNADGVIVITATPQGTPGVIVITATPSSPSSGRTYVVQDGDTLYAIAVRNGVRVAALAQANNISNINLIYAGQTLIIP